MTIRSVVPDIGQKGKFDEVEANHNNTKLQQKLSEEVIVPQVDSEFIWKPTFSRLEVRVVDQRLLSKTSKGGIVLVEKTDKLPYIEVEVVAIGPNAGWDAEHTICYQEFSIGDRLRVFEQHVEFHYLDGLPHNEYFDVDRPYIAFVQDKYTIAKRTKKV